MFFSRSGRPTAFRYFDLLAPVLGDKSRYSDVDSGPADVTMQPLMDNEPDMCRLKYNQCTTCSNTSLAAQVDRWDF